MPCLSLGIAKLARVRFDPSQKSTGFSLPELGHDDARIIFHFSSMGEYVFVTIVYKQL